MRVASEMIPKRNKGLTATRALYDALEDLSNQIAEYFEREHECNPPSDIQLSLAMANIALLQVRAGGIDLPGEKI